MKIFEHVHLVRDLTIPELDALAGTTGSPSASNRFVTDTDPRLVAGSFSGTEVEVDFGAALFQQYREFTVVNGSVTATGKVLLSRSGNAATGKSADENEMDALAFYATPAAGSFGLHVRALEGSVAGPFKFFYSLAT